MKTIDFLPDVYRERMKLRQARVWWGIVVLIFGAAISSTAGAQYLLKQSVEKQFADLESQFLAAQQQVLKLAQLQTDNRTAGQWAGLVTYLEQPWPRSQLLAEIVRPLPESIRLTELIVAQEDLVRPTEEAGPRRRGQREAETQQGKLAPAQADLEQLRRANDFKRPVIEISGVADDDGPLHEYVTRLGRSPLVAKAKIKSIGRAASASIETPLTFTVRIEFRPSYGQADEGNAPSAPDQGQVAQGATGS